MLVIQNLSKRMVQKVLFDDISFKVADKHKVALVGPNGVGKSTLLKILAGLEQPDRGRVITSGEVIGYLPQIIVKQPNQTIKDYMLPALQFDWESYKITESLAKVGLGKVPLFTPIAKLSGGQKMKLGLARLLLQEPTTLLLDEPTNNLDLQSIIWLEKFVKQFPGKVLLVSHDRAFIDSCVNKIIELNPFTHQITEYGGNYTAFREQRLQHLAHQQDAYKKQQAKERHMRLWIAQKQQQLQVYDNPKVARQLKAMKTRLEREIEQQDIDRPQQYQSFEIDQLGNQLHQQKSVITLRDFELHELVSCPELYLYGQDRILLRGPNGAGKTTFIKSLLGLNQYYTGEVETGPNTKLGYFSQEHELLNDADQVIDAYMRHTQNFSESQARYVLGSFLFSKEKVFSLVGSLSQGEKARLLLATVINQKNDFLFLDEPTNHLDLESCEVLEEALAEYTGGFLVVSHDRYFVQEIGITRVLSLREKSIVEV